MTDDPKSSNGGQNGWNEWSRHVLAELKRLNEKMETANRDADEKITQHENRNNERLLEVKEDLTSIMKSIKDEVHGIEDKILSLEIKFASLATEFKFKSGIWGLIGGAIPIMIAIGVYAIKQILAPGGE